MVGDGAEAGADRLAQDLARVNPWLAWWCVEEGHKVSESTRMTVEARSMKLLRAERVQDRRRAVEALAQMRNERVIAPLFEAAGDADAEVATMALQALMEMGEAAHAPVSAALRSSDPQQHERALRYLREQRESVLWLEAFEQLGDTLDVLDRRRAVEALAQMQNERVIAPLFEAAGDVDEEVAQRAVEALTEFGEAVRPLALAALRGKDQRLQRAALWYASAQPTDIVPSAFWQWTLGSAMCYVPPGLFLMGSDRVKDSIARGNEVPQHEITLPGYWIGKTPVTVAQFRSFVRDSDYDKWSYDRQQSGDDHPVVGVSWNNAQAYCQWVGQRTGLHVTLPTEAEWEKAARGLDGRIYPWGYDTPTSELCNYNVGNTTPVGRYSPQGDSYYGCVDMSGNVWEWTSSLYKPYPYRADDGREDVNVDGVRVLRGGSFVGDDSCFRCAYRYSNSPDYTSVGYGFRIALVFFSES
jgi:formylglycine-generating enzyme required for sulfatase activity